MSQTDLASQDFAILFTILAIILIAFAAVYAVSEIINWNKPDIKPKANKLDQDLFKLKLRPRVRAPRLCPKHIVEAGFKIRISVLDSDNCEMCGKKK